MRTQPPPSRRRRWFWLLGLLGAAAVFTGVELWARTVNPQVPLWNGPGGDDPGLMTGHPTRLWGMTEGVKNNGDMTTWINAHGIRGEAPEVPRPEGRQRILTLGDSSFFGFLVSDEDVYTTVLQTYLRDRGVDVEVVNAGIAGYSIAQHQMFMEEEGWALEPTLIVYCNLWSDNTWDTFMDEDLLASRRFAHFNPLIRSAAIRLLAAKLSQAREGESGKLIFWREDQGWPEGKVRRVPLTRFMGIHDDIVRKAAAKGIGGAFMIPTNSALISREHVPDTASAWDPYFQAFRRLGSHHSMPVVELTSVFDAGIEEGLGVEDLVLDLMHPSPEGHRRIAEALGAALLEAGWPDEPLVGQSTPLDASDLHDLPGVRWTDDAGAGSPQQRLFEISRGEQVAMAERAAAMAASGPVPEGKVGPDADPDADVVLTPPPTGAWALQITVEGGKSPFKLVVRDPEGHAEGSARLLKPMTIRLMMRAGLDVVSVEVTDRTGKMVTALMTQDKPHGKVSLGGGGKKK